jgi:hypothetical protein
LRLWTSIVIPLASIFVAGLAVVTGAWFQRVSVREQAALKHYEVNFVPKQRGYSDFMLAFDSAIGAVGLRNKQEFVMQMERMNSAFYSLEPFLGDQGRQGIRAEYLLFLDTCNQKLAQPKPESAVDEEAFLTKTVSSKNKLKNMLYASLFAAD